MWREAQRQTYKVRLTAISRVEEDVGVVGHAGHFAEGLALITIHLACLNTDSSQLEGKNMEARDNVGSSLNQSSARGIPIPYPARHPNPTKAYLGSNCRQGPHQLGA